MCSTPVSTDAEFELASATAVVRTFYYSCCPGEPWPQVSTVLVIKRAATFFYISVLIIPTIMLSFFALFSLYVSPASGERLSYTLTILLARAFYQATIQQFTPISHWLMWINVFDMYNEWVG